MKRKKIYGLISIVLFSCITLPTFLDSAASASQLNNTTVNLKQEVKSDFGVGQGITWPKQVNAPYIDMVAWTSDPDYSNNGAANLAKISTETGVNFFNLGFIQSSGQGIKDGKVAWGWGGYNVLSESNKDDVQYNGIKKSIRELREIGGDVTISFGGIAGTAFWQVTQDVDVLANTYLDIVNGYGLTRLDLDIEGGAQNKEQNIANAKAIKKVQDLTGVDVALTLPVLPDGLTPVQLNVLEAYLSEGVDIELVNIMTMCYGNSTLLPGENYGTASLRAVDSTKDQLKTYFKKHANINLSDAEAYSKIGTTVSIGYEGSGHPIFTTEWSKLVVDHAIEKGIGMTSFWSMNRDAKIQANIGVNSQYEFTNIFKNFGEKAPVVNSKPVIKGAEDTIIKLGDSFDPLKGVTATDKEDGNLTSKITVSGNVDINTAGKYTLTYKVSDKEGLETIVNRVITVTENSVNPPVEADAYDHSKVYVAGDKVIYKGELYEAKWWVQGEYPDTSDAWKKL